MPGLQVQPMVGVSKRDNQSMFGSLSLSLPSPLPEINKYILEWGFKKSLKNWWKTIHLSACHWLRYISWKLFKLSKQICHANCDLSDPKQSPPFHAGGHLTHLSPPEAGRWLLSPHWLLWGSMLPGYPSLSLGPKAIPPSFLPPPSHKPDGIQSALRMAGAAQDTSATNHMWTCPPARSATHSTQAWETTQRRAESVGPGGPPLGFKSWFYPHLLTGWSWARYFTTWKIIKHGRKKLKKIQISGSIYRVHGLEELTSLKCPYYPKQPIESVQLLSRHQWHILQN